MSNYELVPSQPPTPSSRPPVTGYRIFHNTTGNVMVNNTNDTKFTVEGVAPGVYIFAIVPVNAFGEGKEAIFSIIG